MKINTETTHHVDCNDFEEAVREHYGQPFDFVADQESGNDITHVFYVTTPDTESKLYVGWEGPDLEKFKESGDYNGLAGVILDDMAGQGLIPTGTYAINVSW